MDDLSQSGERQIDALALRERVAAVCTDAWKTWEPEMKRSIEQIVDGVGTLYGTAFYPVLRLTVKKGKVEEKRKWGELTLCAFLPIELEIERSSPSWNHRVSHLN